MLGPWQVADLVAARADEIGTGSDADDVTYGAPLVELLGRTGFVGDFLEAAAFAGYTQPALLEGLRTALRAHFEWLMGQIDEHEAEGVLGDAIRHSDARSHRDLVVLLEEQVAALEERAAALHRVEPEDEVDQRFIRLWERQARAAQTRATRARERADRAGADTVAAAAEAGWYDGQASSP